MLIKTFVNEVWFQLKFVDFNRQENLGRNLLFTKAFCKIFRSLVMSNIFDKTEYIIFFVKMHKVIIAKFGFN